MVTSVIQSQPLILICSPSCSTHRGKHPLLSVANVQDRNAFKKVHQETFGKSGCRRIVPGQLLAVDPKGRACLIAAAEKQKLVYVLNRDAAANLTISSPLEAHKSHHLCFAVTGLDMGFDNPVFAAIELDYADADQVCSPEYVQLQTQCRVWSLLRAPVSSSQHRCDRCPCNHCPTCKAGQ